ncbi:hypothetical protein LFZ31_10315 [Salmonella enterica subsp. enterica serovar Newport str. S09097]|nr:hypothetical protein LFZ31_10315 [Salmonella enterica subsp. enterica serovar Newport str. S09097]
METRIVSKGMTRGDVQAKNAAPAPQQQAITPISSQTCLYLAELVIYCLFLQQFDNILRQG